ncbi:MAG: hypothetical protein CMJ17_12020 [Phenylobacterium sp.]|nr:hypothetical protein [Phenylobacterium sp.]
MSSLQKVVVKKEIHHYLYHRTYLYEQIEILSLYFGQDLLLYNLGFLMEYSVYPLEYCNLF